MIGLSCLFRPCNWVFLGNIFHAPDGHVMGLYQCTRCKTLSTGSPNGPHNVPAKKAKS